MKRPFLAADSPNPWSLILPCLTPSEISLVALTCRKLALTCRLLTESRTLDAAQGQEPWAIPFENAVDSARYASFRYSAQSVVSGALSLRGRWGAEGETQNGEPQAADAVPSGNRQRGGSGGQSGGENEEWNGRPEEATAVASRERRRGSSGGPSSTSVNERLRNGIRELSHRQQQQHLPSLLRAEISASGPGHVVPECTLGGKKRLDDTAGYEARLGYSCDVAGGGFLVADRVAGKLGVAYALGEKSCVNGADGERVLVAETAGRDLQLESNGGGELRAVADLYEVQAMKEASRAGGQHKSVRSQKVPGPLDVLVAGTGCACAMGPSLFAASPSKGGRSEGLEDQPTGVEGEATTARGCLPCSCSCGRTLHGTPAYDERGALLELVDWPGEDWGGSVSRRKWRRWQKQEQQMQEEQQRERQQEEQIQQQQEQEQQQQQQQHQHQQQQQYQQQQQQQQQQQHQQQQQQQNQRLQQEHPPHEQHHDKQLQQHPQGCQLANNDRPQLRQADGDASRVRGTPDLEVEARRDREPPRERGANSSSRCHDDHRWSGVAGNQGPADLDPVLEGDRLQSLHAPDNRAVRDTKNPPLELSQFATEGVWQHSAPPKRANLESRRRQLQGAPHEPPMPSQSLDGEERGRPTTCGDGQMLSAGIAAKSGTSTDIPLELSSSPNHSDTLGSNGGSRTHSDRSTSSSGGCGSDSESPDAGHRPSNWETTNCSNQGDSRGTSRGGGPGPSPGPVFECGPACGCGLRCANRVTQRGVAVAVRVVRHRGKGWGLHVLGEVAKGTFVCEYAGEFLRNSEAAARIEEHELQLSRGRRSPFFVLVVREHLPSGTGVLRVNVDNSRVGNIARFINHACDGGNLAPCLVRRAGNPMPRICLFASRDIAAGEELTFCYGAAPNARSSVEGRGPLEATRCFCGTPSCTGLLPREATY